MAFLLRRIAFALLLVFVVSTSALLLVTLAPGDFASESLGIEARRERVAALRAQYGLDRPFVQQYTEWIGRAARLDFGRSLVYDRPVAELIPARAANTAILALVALVAATLVGIPLGVVTGSRRGLLPAVVRSFSLVLLSLPPLLTSLLLVLLAARTGWLPLGGMRSSADSGIVDVLTHLIIPATALALPLAAMFERLQSDAVRETLREPFVVAALARGASRRRAIWRHAFKVALKPTAAIYGLMIGTLLSGSFAVEMVTAWPGLGRLMFDALRARDVYLVAGCAAWGSVFLAAGSLVSDVAVGLLDPRVRE